MMYQKWVYAFQNIFHFKVEELNAEKNGRLSVQFQKISNHTPRQKGLKVFGGRGEGDFCETEKFEDIYEALQT